MGQITKPPILDETGQRIALAMESIAAGKTKSFEGCTTEFNQDGSITITYEDRIHVIVFNQNGSITETMSDLSGTVYETKTTVFNQDGSITETVTYPSST